MDIEMRKQLDVIGQQNQRLSCNSLNELDDCVSPIVRQGENDSLKSTKSEEKMAKKVQDRNS